MAKNGMTWSDVGRIQWGPTLKLALGRGVASGLVIAVVLLATGSQNGDVALPTALAVWAGWSVTSFVVAPLMQLFLKGLAGIFNAMGIGIAVFATNLMIWMVALMVAVGDPIVFALNRALPGLFEARDFGFINLQPAIFILADIDEVRPAATDMI